jgi:hypothetical protein
MKEKSNNFRRMGLSSTNNGLWFMVSSVLSQK